MSKNIDAGAVKRERSEFCKMLDDFKLCHESVQALLPDDVRENENLEWYEPKIQKYHEFLNEIETWLKQLDLTELDPQTLVDVTDSISRVSKAGSSSSVSAARIQIAVDKAGLLARAKALKEKHEIQMDKVKLQARIGALQLKEDIAVTNAKLKVLEEIEPSPETKPTPGTEDDMNAYLEEYMEKELHKTGPAEAKSASEPKRYSPHPILQN